MASTKKALIIGCNYPNDPNHQLYGCINDASNIANTLVDAFDYDLNNIMVLRDDFATNVPTRNNILYHLNKLVRESSKLTEIWVFYSGHGSKIRDLNNDETDGLDEVIVPTDFLRSGFITDDEIFNALKNVSPKCRVILLFDSCHSGSMCDNEQRAVGAFTTFFLYCLRLNHFNVDVFKLFSDICGAITSSGYSQNPQLSCSSSKLNFAFTRSTYRELSTLSNPTPKLSNGPKKGIMKMVFTFG